MKTTIISRVMRRLLGRLEQWRPWPIAALALVSYVPLLLTHRGQVGADTKSYLYLNPGKLLADAPWLWETGVGLGTVTHQNIGYLWPLWDPMRQTFADKLMKTVVIKIK